MEHGHLDVIQDVSYNYYGKRLCPRHLPPITPPSPLSLSLSLSLSLVLSVPLQLRARAYLEAALAG
jgi:hypothetical protein